MSVAFILIILNHHKFSREIFVIPISLYQTEIMPDRQQPLITTHLNLNLNLNFKSYHCKFIIF